MDNENLNEILEKMSLEISKEVNLIKHIKNDFTYNLDKVKILIKNFQAKNSHLIDEIQNINLIEIQEFTGEYDKYEVSPASSIENNILWFNESNIYDHNFYKNPAEFLLFSSSSQLGNSYSVDVKLVNQDKKGDCAIGIIDRSEYMENKSYLGDEGCGGKGSIGYDTNGYCGCEGTCKTIGSPYWGVGDVMSIVGDLEHVEFYINGEKKFEYKFKQTLNEAWLAANCVGNCILEIL